MKRFLVFEALFGFAIGVLSFSQQAWASGPGNGVIRPQTARVAFDDPQAMDTPYQHRPVVVKRAHAKPCHKPITDAKMDSSARNQIVERHVEQCQKAEVARRLEERRQQLEQQQQIQTVSARR